MSQGYQYITQSDLDKVCNKLRLLGVCCNCHVVKSGLTARPKLTLSHLERDAHFHLLVGFRACHVHSKGAGHQNHSSLLTAF